VPIEEENMKKAMLILSILALFALSGCYHAVIDTGKTPGTMTIYKPWASAWIYGLVPPSVVSTAAECPNGVARVETQLSFVNQLVGAITFGIYTPMQIKVTCAAGGMSAVPTGEADLTIADPFDDTLVAQTFQEAAKLAVDEHRPVFVQFTGI
jgi:hypothetical protein